MKLSFAIIYAIISSGFFVMAIVVGLFHQYVTLLAYSILVLLMIFLVLFAIAAARKIMAPIHVLQLRAHEAAKNLQAEKVSLRHWQAALENKSRVEKKNLQEIIRALEEKVKHRSVDLEKAVGNSHILAAQLHAKEAQIVELKEELMKAVKKPAKKATKKKNA